MIRRQGGKYRTVICLPGLAALLLGLAGPALSSLLPAQSVKFLKTVDFQKGKGKRSVTSFLLGKKSKTEINPTAICRLTPDRLCITDSVNGAVIIIDNNGKVKKKITRARGLRLASPVSVCSDDRGSFYVADSANRIVLKFGTGLKFQKIFIAHPGARITGIVFGAFKGGAFYCTDTPNHRILCFNRDGRLTNSFGERGTGPVQFNFPTHITADDRYLYVTDAMNFRVQVLTHTGEFVRAIGSMGRGGGNFSKPKGLAVDQKRRIYTADAMFDNIQIFSLNGDFLYYFGGPGHKEGEFWMPADVMTDNDNHIWVTDTYNHRLQVFKLSEEAP